MTLAVCLWPWSEGILVGDAGSPLDLSFYSPPRNYVLPPATEQGPRNVILFIGDGMGFGQVTVARIRAGGPDCRLWMDTMPVTGIVLTHSANSLVTDSAAASTAMACAIKTNNNMIGRDPNTQYRSILEAARQMGLRTGLVVTKSITDATPAGFASHVRHRDMQAVIAVQLLAARPDVLLGGGKAYFLPRGVSGSKRRDRRDLFEEARRAGYSYIEDLSQAGECYHMLLGLFAMDAMTTKTPEPSIAQMTSVAIQVLDASRDCNGVSIDRPGFFLMVEGSQIDTACHNNDLNQMVRQLLLFDMAIKVGLEFAASDGRTLVLVTADHETGGLQIIPPPSKSGTSDEDEIQPTRQLHVVWTNKAHTGLPVPLYAYGPRAILFTGLLDNTQIPKRLCQLLGIGPVPAPLQLVSSP
ncbi:MAG: alkaline phosphatase [Sedimentisphaerales bacterium]|nr:alkaline phosphatase [Sedimentisphaerales bacterium]